MQPKPRPTSEAEKEYERLVRGAYRRWERSKFGDATMAHGFYRGFYFGFTAALRQKGKRKQ